MIYKNGRFYYSDPVQTYTVFYTQEKVEDHICRHYLIPYILMHIYVSNNSIYIGGSYEIVVVYIVSLICLLSGPKQAVCYE